MKKCLAVLIASILSFTCLPSHSLGFDEVQLKKLLALGHCPECDLSGADLQGADLTGAKIEDTIFCNTKTPWGLDNSGCK